jgi:hypothetical protein
VARGGRTLLDQLRHILEVRLLALVVQGDRGRRGILAVLAELRLHVIVDELVRSNGRLVLLLGRHAQLRTTTRQTRYDENKERSFYRSS